MGLRSEMEEALAAINQAPSRSPPLRIGIVTPRFFPDIGGIETHVYEVSRRLAQQGHSVTILTTDRTQQLPMEESVGGVMIKRVRAWPHDRDYYFAPGIYHEV